MAYRCGIKDIVLCFSFRRPVVVLSALIFMTGIFLAGLCGGPHSGFAQTLGYSTTERVGFAFYHLINQSPPFDDWIKGRDDYKAAKPNVRLDILDHDRLRLREGFAAYFVDRDFLTITSPLQFDIIDNPDFKKSAAAQESGLKKRLRIRLPMPVEGQIYFPFQVGKMWVGLIPNDIESIFTQDLNEDDYKIFCRAIGDCTNFKNRVMQTTIIMRATAADIKTPMMDGDQPIWLMLADVGAVFIEKNGQPVEWRYTAPWYAKHQNQELMTLFGN